MQRRVLAIVLGLGAPVLAADLAYLEDLLEQAGAVGQIEDARRASAYEAKRELSRQLNRIDDDLLDAMALRLSTALDHPRPEMRVAAAEALAVKPREGAGDGLLAALQRETKPAVRRVFVRSVTRAIAGLPQHAREAVIPSALDVFGGMIRSRATEPELRCQLAVSLGRLGPVALPTLRAFREDSRLRVVLHSILPMAFAATGDPTAGGDILALYGSDASVGFRVGCLDALGRLLRQNEGVGGGELQSVIDLLRSTIVEGPDPTLAAAAALAYSRWPGAKSDQQIVGIVQDRLPDASGDELTAYLRALVALDLPLGARARAFLEATADSGTAPARHQKIASALLAMQTGGQ